MSKGPCSVEGCESGTHAQGYCQRHYRLWKKYGVPENKPRDQYEKPGPKIDPSKPRSKAHGGLKPACVNGHKFTPENTGYVNGKRVCLTCRRELTHCPQGHPYDEENTYVDSSGYKHCRTCRRERVAKWREDNNYQAPLPDTCSAGHEYPEDAEIDAAGRRVCPECVADREAARKARQEERTHCVNGHQYVEGSWYRDTNGNLICAVCREETVSKARKKRYGLTDDQYRALEEKQGHKCAICLTPFEELNRKPGIDHFHDCCPKGSSCGECVRGLLCHRCNTVLGMMDDSPEMLIRAAEYLMNADKFRAQKA
jgi:hypothetical protein